MKTDFKASLASYRASIGEFCVVNVPPMSYLMIDGAGDPNTAEDYADALAALYPVAYKLKFASKRDVGRDYVVPPLEALWWAQDMNAFTTARDKSRWLWTTMLMTPEWVTPAMVENAIARAGTAKNYPPSLGRIRHEVLVEGTSVQTLHVGPYDEEARTLQDLHQRFLPDSNLQATGKHHEVYLNDPRRTDRTKLRTILRQPVSNIEPGK